MAFPRSLAGQPLGLEDKKASNQLKYEVEDGIVLYILYQLLYYADVGSRRLLKVMQEG